MQTASVADRARSRSGRSPRRVPIPATEPPYEDVDARRMPGARQAGHELVTQGSLALDLRDDDLQPTALTARHLSLVDELDDECDDTFFAPQRTPRIQLPNPKPWCGRFVQALVEVLAGERPATQLMRWTSDGIFVEINRRVRIVSRARGTAPAAQARVRPAGRAGSPVVHRRIAVRSVHICEPADGVAEAAVHVQHGGRSRAIALRIEGLDGRWRCTALQLG